MSSASDLLDAFDRWIEQIARTAPAPGSRTVPSWRQIDVGRSERSRQLLQRKHFLDTRQIAGDGTPMRSPVLLDSAVLIASKASLQLD